MPTESWILLGVFASHLIFAQWMVRRVLSSNAMWAGTYRELSAIFNHETKAHVKLRGHIWGMREEMETWRHLLPTPLQEKWQATIAHMQSHKIGSNPPPTTP